MRLAIKAIESLSVLPLVIFASACATNAQTQSDSFIALSDAYAVRDAEAAAQTYVHNAQVIYAYDGTPEERFIGRADIKQSFAEFFAQVSSDLKLDLNFRISKRMGDELHGVYRLQFGGVETSYGRFNLTQRDHGQFVRDRSSSATRSDFEETPGPLLVRPDDNVLDRDYYSLLTGRYRLPDGCDIVVTRSIVRLFARNTCDQTWRGLDRVSGLEWTAGDSVLPKASSTTFRFSRVTSDLSSIVTLETADTRVIAQRHSLYTTQDVTFDSSDGTRLAGTLYLPKGRSNPGPATVLVHGSGPQDRDGYASIIAVFADALATEGRVVLAFDKRGSGTSQGNGNAASFYVLGSDARAAMDYLATRKEVDASRIGLAGSSQAGWVVAKAIEMGAKPADVFLLGAAGTAFTVREQNLYNTDVRMACAGIPENLRRVALDQQAAFFDAFADRSKSARLDALTEEGATHPEIRDWLFPDSSGLTTEGAWFTVLDPSFDPLQVWKGYPGKAVFAFSEFDDSTDTEAAISRLTGVDAHLVRISDSQHLGLIAATICDGELGERDAFSPALFEALGRFGSSEAR